MKTKFTITSLLLVMLLALRSLAQQDPMITQYQSNQIFINPGYVGSHDYATICGLYRKQWVSFPGAPTTAFLSYENRIKCSNVGIGLTLVHDQIGVSNKTDISALFAYHIKAGKGQLSLGLKASVGYYNARLTDLRVWDQSDMVFAGDILNKWIPNFGAGAYYYTPKFYAGIAVPSLIKYQKPSDNVMAEISRVPNYQRHYFITSGYVFDMGSNVYLKPSTFIKYTNNAPIEADLNLNVFFLNRFNIGGGYRTRDGIMAMAEMYVTNNIRVGYAYDYPLTDINMYSTGSHEIMLAYDFVRDLIKIKTPRFF